MNSKHTRARTADHDAPTQARPRRGKDGKAGRSGCRQNSRQDSRRDWRQNQRQRPAMRAANKPATKSRRA